MESTQEKWTPAELQAEWMVVKATRLGILCGDGMPNADALKLATDEANDHIRQLRDGPMSQGRLGV